MTETLRILVDIVDYMFFILCFVFFYLAIKKCFWKGEKSKLKFFFLTFVTYPFFCILLALEISFVLGYVFTGSDSLDPLDIFGTDGMIIYSGTASIIYFFIILLCARIMGKWLRLKSKAPMLYLYLMFNTFFIFQFRGGSSQAFSNINADYVFDIAAGLVSILLLVIFYRVNVLEFAKLPIEEMEINWKVFILPPAVFVVIYAAFSVAISYVDNVMVIFTECGYSVAIVILFIWAFYVIIKNMQATYAVKTLSVEVMEALAHTIDAKDEYTKGHSVRVAKYSRMLAEKLGLSPKDCESVYYMALLHDIGKIGVPNSIINSKTRLTDEEFAVIKKHPGLGYDILSEIKSRPDLSTGARWHHERFDGKGYPDKKSGEEIPYFARIIAVADSYDAMTSNRSYRSYLSQEAVRLEIEKNSGTQFDRDVARCMLDVIDEDKEYKLHE